MTLLLDCTELLLNPIGTGIQRVVRELLRAWPADAAQPRVVRFAAGRGLVAVPQPAIDAVLHPATSPAEIAALCAETLPSAGAAPIDPAGHTIVIPEVFFDEARCTFYETLLEARTAPIGMLVYDILPYTDPALFRLATAAPLMPYLRVLMRAHALAFISARTRDEVLHRVLRRNPQDPTLRPTLRPGPILRPGADAAAWGPQRWRPARRGFVAVGTIDGRKNQAVLAEAFRRLWEEGSHSTLTLCGRVLEHAQLGWMSRVRHDPRFTWLPAASDAEIAAIMAEARATLFVSAAEGYGLPPLESLHAGIPVIVHDQVPSLEGVSPAGQVRLPEATPEAIMQAVRALEDDATAMQRWGEAARVALPTWRAFAADMAAWAHALA